MYAIHLGIILFSLTSVLSDSGRCRREDCEFSCSFIPIEGECNSYCFCTSGKDHAHELKCPEKETFDPFLAICVSEDEYKCPDIPPSGVECSKLPDGLYKHPSSCNNYVHCSNGYEHVQPCGANLHFCDHCEPKRCEFPDIANFPNSGVDCAKLPDGWYKHRNRCDVYVHCSNGFEHVQPCPNNLHFCDHCEPKKCEFPDIAKCQEEMSCKHDGFYADEKDCTRYYHCATGQKIELTCPKGLEWCGHCNHPRCEYPHIANCKAKRQKSDKFNFEFSDFRNRVRVSSPLFRASANSMNEVFNCTIPNGIYTVPSDSSLYLICHGGSGAFYKCPSGQTFDQETKSCVTSSPYILLTSKQCHKFSETYS